MGDDSVSDALKEKLEELNSAFDANGHRLDSLTFDVEQVATSIHGLLQEVQGGSRTLAFCSALLFARRNSLLSFLDTASGDHCKADKDLVRARVTVYGIIELWIKKLYGRNLNEYADGLLHGLYTAFMIELGDNKRHAVKPIKELFLQGTVKFQWSKMSLERFVKTLFDLVLKGSRARNTATLRGKPKGEAMAIMGLLLRRYSTEIGDRPFDYGEPLRRKLLAYCLHVLQKESDKVQHGKRPELYLMSGALECIRHAFKEMKPGPQDIERVFAFVSRFVVVPESGLPNYFVPEESLNIIRLHAPLFRSQLLKEHVNFYSKVEKCVLQKQYRVRKASVPAVKAVLEQIAEAVSEGTERSLQERKSILLAFIRKFHGYISRFEEYSGDLTNALVEVAVHAFGCFAKSIRLLQSTESLKQILLKLFEISEHFDREESRQAVGGQMISTANAGLYTSNAPSDSSSGYGGASELGKGTRVTSTEVGDQAEVRSESIVRNSAFLKAFARILAELPHEMIMSNNDEALLEVIAKSVLNLAGDYYKCPRRDQYLITDATTLVMETLNEKSEVLTANVLAKVTRPVLVQSLSTLPEGTMNAGIYDPETGLSDLRLLFEYEHFWSTLFRCSVGTQVFDHWIRAVLDIVKTANLNVVLHPDVKAKQEELGEEAEFNLYLEQTLGNIENLHPESPLDFKCFINLVDLCRRVLPPQKASFNRELFAKWRHPWVSACIKASNKFSYASGLYRLLEIGFTIINDEGMSSIDEWEYLDRFLKLALVRSRQYKDELLCAILACVLHTPTLLVTPRLKLLIPCLLNALDIGLSFPALGLCALETFERWILGVRNNMLDPFMPQILPALGRYLNAPKEKTAKEGNAKDGKLQMRSGEPGELESKVMTILGRIGGKSQMVMPPLKQLLEDSVVWDTKPRVKVEMLFDKMQLEVCLDEALPRLVELATTTTNRKVKVAACEALHGITIYMIGRSATQPSPSSEFARILRRVFPCIFQLAIDVETVTRQLFAPLVEQIATWFARNAQRENGEIDALLDTALENLGHHSNGALRDVAGNILSKFVKFTIKSGSTSAVVNIKALLRRLYVLMKHPDPHQRLGSCLAFEKFYVDFRENSALVDEFVFELLRNAFLSLKIAHRDPKELATVKTASGFLGHLFRIISKYSKILAVYNRNRRGFKDIYHVLRWLFRMLHSRETAFRAKCSDAFLVFCSSVQELRDAVSPPVHPARAFVLSKIEGKKPGVATDSDDDAEVNGEGGIEAIVSMLEVQVPVLSVDGKALIDNSSGASVDKTRWMENLAGSMDAYHMLISYKLVLPAEFKTAKANNSVEAFTKLKVALANLAKFTIESEEVMAGEMDQDVSVPFNVMVETLISALRFVAECLKYDVLEDMMNEVNLVSIAAETAVMLLLQPETLGFTSKADPREDPVLVATTRTLLERISNTGMPEGTKASVLSKQRGLVEDDIFSGKSHSLLTLKQAMLRGHAILFEVLPMGPTEAKKLGAKLGQKLLQLNSSPPPLQLDLSSALLRLAFTLGWPCVASPMDDTCVLGLVLHKEGGRRVFRYFEEMLLAYMLEKGHWKDVSTVLLGPGASHASFQFYLFVKAVSTFVAAKDTIRDIHLNLCSDELFIAPILDSLSAFVKTQDQAVVDEYELRAWHFKLSTLFAALSTISLLSSPNQQLDNLLYTLLDLLLTERTAISTKAEALAAIGNLLPGTVGGMRKRILRDDESDCCFSNKVLTLVRRRVVVNHFPLEPSREVDGKRADELSELLKGLLAAMEASGAPGLFALFDKVLREGDRHRHAVEISQGFGRMARRVELKKREGLDASLGSCLGWTVVAKIVANSSSQEKQTAKQALTSWVLHPLLDRMNMEAWAEFLLYKSAQLDRARAANKLVGILKDEKRDYVTRDCACQVACKLFECLNLADVKQINMLYKKDDKANAYTIALVKFLKVQFKQVKPHVIGQGLDSDAGAKGSSLKEMKEMPESGTFLLSRLSEKQRFYSTMFQGYCSIICRTQTKGKFFYGLITWLLTGIDTTRWHVLIPLVQGTDTEFQFTVETNFTRKQLSSAKLLLPSPDVQLQRTFAALTSLATPSQGILATDDTAALGEKRADEEEKGLAVECGADEEEELDLDPFNSLPAMKSLLAVLDVMRKGDLLGLEVPLEDAIKSQSLPLPEWMETLLAALKGSSSSHSRETIHIRLFVCRLIMNRPTLFAAFAKRLVEPLVELALFIEKPYGTQRGFHYLFRDLYILFGRWHRLNPNCCIPRESERSVVVLSAWLEHLTQVCANERSYVLRMNLQMINRLMNMWKSFNLSISTTRLVSLIKAPPLESGKKAAVAAGMNRVVGLNLMGAMAQSGALSGIDEMALAGLVDNLVHKSKGIRLLCADVLATVLIALTKAESPMAKKLEDKVKASLEAAHDHEVMRQKRRAWVDVIHAFMIPAIEAKLDVSGVVSRLMRTLIISLLAQLQGEPFEMAFRIAEYACPKSDLLAKAISIADTLFHDATDCSSFVTLDSIVGSIFDPKGDNIETCTKVLRAAAKHRNAKCRLALVKVLSHVYAEDKVELAQKEEIRLVLLAALSDASPEVSSTAMAFWTANLAAKEQPLMSTLTATLTELKPFSSARSIDPKYWTCATGVMLLSKVRSSPEYNNEAIKLFDRPLSECNFNPVALDASWQHSIARSQPVTASQPLEPLFSQAFTGTIGSQPHAFGTQSTQFLSQRFAQPGMVRATQEYQRFAPTQVLGGPDTTFLGTQADAALSRPSQALGSTPSRKRRRVAARGTSQSQGISQSLFKVEESTQAGEEMPPPESVHKKALVSVIPRHLDKSFSRVVAAKVVAGKSQTQSGLNRFQILNLKKRKASQAMQKRAEQKRARQVVIYRKYRKGEIPDIQITLKDLVEPLLALCALDAPFSTAILIAVVRALYTRLDKQSLELLNRYYQSLLEGTCTHPSFIACVQRLIHGTLGLGGEMQVSSSSLAKAGLASHNHASSILLLEAMGKHGGAEEEQETLLELYRMYEQLDEKDVMLGIMQGLSQDALPALRLHVAGDYAAAAKEYNKLCHSEEVDSEALLAVWEQAKVENLFMACRWQRILKEAEVQVQDSWGSDVAKEGQRFWMGLWQERLRDVYLRPFLVGSIRLPQENQAFLSLIRQSLERSSTSLGELEDGKAIPDHVFRSQWCAEKAPVELVLFHLLKEVPAFGLAQGSVDAYMSHFLDTWTSLPSLAVNSRRGLLNPLQRVVDCADFLRCRRDILLHNWNVDEAMLRLQVLLDQWQTSLPSPTLNTSDQWEACIFIRNKLLLLLRTEACAREDTTLHDKIREKVKIFAASAYRAAANAAGVHGAFSLANKYVKYLQHLNDDSYAFEAIRIKRMQVSLSSEIGEAKKKLRHLIEHIVSSDFVLTNTHLNTGAALLNAQLAGCVYADLAEVFAKSGDVSEEQTEARSALDTAFALLSKAADGYLHPKDVLYEPQHIAEACFVFGQFCNKMARVEWAADRLGETKLVQLAIEHYLTAASFGSVQAIDAFPKILELLTKYGKIAGVKDSFQDTIDERCSAWIFLRWIPQILSLVADKNGELVAELLDCIAREYPHVLYSPFRVSMDALREKHATKGLPMEIASIATRITPRLKNPLIDAFVEALQGLNHPELRLQDALKLMNRALSSSEPEEKVEAKARKIFTTRFLEDLGCTHKAHVGDQVGSYNLQYTRRYIQRWMKKHDLTSATKFSLSKWRRALKDLKVQPAGDLREMATEKFSTWLSDYSDSDVASTGYSLLVPGEYEKLQRPGRLVRPTEQNKITISSFGQQLKVMASLRKPKRLVIRGSDEQDYAFLVKGGEDLRLDQRIEQLFAVMNHVFQQSASCAARNLQVKEYSVIPLSLDTGILGWLNDTTPLQTIIEEQYNAHTQLKEYEKTSKGRKRFTIADLATTKSWRNWFAKGFKSKYTSMYESLDMEADIAQFDQLTESMPSDLLQRHILAITSSPESFLALRSQTARSIGCLSMCSYVLGIGDRHLANFLFDEKDGTVIPIDFGYSFGIGVTMLPVPETTPFRFTNVFSNLLDPLGHDGLYKNTMLHVLNSLHQQPDLLMNTMEVFLKEPLIDWAADITQSTGIPEEVATDWISRNRVNCAKLKLQAVDPVEIMCTELQQRKAMKHLQKHPAAPRPNSVVDVMSQLYGTDPNVDLLSKDAHISAVGVTQQVDRLIDMATNPSLLLRQFEGFASWV